MIHSTNVLLSFFEITYVYIISNGSYKNKTIKTLLNNNLYYYIFSIYYFNPTSLIQFGLTYYHRYHYVFFINKELRKIKVHAVTTDYYLQVTRTLADIFASPTIISAEIIRFLETNNITDKRIYALNNYCI